MQHAAATAGDRGGALLALYDEALPRVYGYLLQRCGRAVLAEDLCAQTFLAAVGALRRENPPPVSVPWLIGVARHKLIDHWRAQSREERGLTLVGGGAEIEADDPWEAQIDTLRAREILEKLAPQHRAALTLRYRGGN